MISQSPVNGLANIMAYRICSFLCEMRCSRRDSPGAQSGSGLVVRHHNRTPANTKIRMPTIAWVLITPERAYPRTGPSFSANMIPKPTTNSKRTIKKMAQCSVLVIAPYRWAVFVNCT